MEVFVWFVTIQVLGLLALPFTCSLFKNLPDRGYAFSKALPILLISFILWLTASAHILPNTRWAIFLIVIIFAAGSILLFWRRRREILTFISEQRKIILVTEALFLLAFIFWIVVRAYNPDILFGEKYMDIAFINATIRSTYFPPYDPWISGIDFGYYYYFGYLMVATLTKITGISSIVTYNLSLALIFALISVGVFSIAYNLMKLMKRSFKTAVGFGLVAAGFVAVLANLEGVLELMHCHGFSSERFWGWVDIGSLNKPYTSAEWYPTDHWWWWRASRVISTSNLDYTINEFPFWSSFFADLHAHLIAIPFALLNMAIGLELFLSPVSLGLKWIQKNWGKLILIAICLGALVFLNSWDLVTYTLIFVIFIALGEYLRQGGFNARWLTNVIAFCIPLVLLVVLLYLPYTMKMITSIGRLTTTAGSGEAIIFGIAPYYGIGTRPFHFFLFWGVFTFISISFVLNQTWCMLGERGVQLKHRAFRLLQLPSKIQLRQFIIGLFAISILLVIAREFAGVGNASLRGLWGLILALSILYIVVQSAQLLRASVIRSKRQLVAAILVGALIFACLPLILGAAKGISHLYFLILPSIFLFILTCFMLSLILGKNDSRNFGRWGVIGAIMLPLLPLVVWGAEVNWHLVSGWAKASPAFFLDKFGILLPAMIMLTLTLLLIASKLLSGRKNVERVERAPVFALVLLFLGFLLLVGCELFNIDDRGSGTLERVTTVFKLYLQAWVLIGIGSAIGLYHLASRWRLLSVPQMLSAATCRASVAVRPFKRPLSNWCQAAKKPVSRVFDEHSRKTVLKLFKASNREMTLVVLGATLMIAAVWITVASPSTVFGMIALFIIGAVIAFSEWRRRHEADEVKTGESKLTGQYIWQKSAQALWWAVCIVLIAGCCIFPIASLIHKTHKFSGDATLDGMAWMQRNVNYRDDYQAINWLRDNVEGSPVIVEAVGSHYAGWFWVSSYTGLPTIVGRWGQVPTWVVDIDQEDARDRERAAETIYTSADLEEVQRVLSTYNVSYVYLGYREQNKYGANISLNFTDFMDVAFQNQGVTIYQVRGK